MNYTCIGHLYNASSAEAHISGFTIKLAIQSGKQEVQKKYFSLIFGKHSPIILVMDMFVCLNDRTLLGQPLQFRLTLFTFFQGHVHLTDFNIATILEDGKLATSMSGTKPYMGKNREVEFISFRTLFATVLKTEECLQICSCHFIIRAP